MQTQNSNDKIIKNQSMLMTTNVYTQWKNCRTNNITLFYYDAGGMDNFALDSTCE